MANTAVLRRLVQKNSKEPVLPDKEISNAASGDRLDMMAAWTKQKLEENPEWFVNDCVASNYPRKIHPWSTWKYLQDVYQEELVKFGRKDEEFDSWNATQTGMQIPYYIRDDGPRGRSVYTAIPIPKGTRIWKPYKLATFENPQQLVSFLRRLHHDLQCDALLWAYPDKGSETVALALDVGTYVNHAESKELLNLDTKCRARRDILAGEELLEDYSKFIGVDTLEWFNIIRSVAWDEPSSTNQTSSETESGIHRGYVHLGVPSSSFSNGASEHDINIFSSELAINTEHLWNQTVMMSAICFVGLFLMRHKLFSGKSPRSRFKPDKSVA